MFIWIIDGPLLTYIRGGLSVTDMDGSPLPVQG